MLTGFPAMPEAIIGGLLVAGAVIVYATNFYRLFEAWFAGILLIQSLPFLSAVALGGPEGLNKARNPNTSAIRQLL